MSLTERGKILLISALIWNFADGLLGPLFAIYTQRIGGNLLDITAAWAIYLIVFGILTIFFGKLSDLYGKHTLLLFGYALTTFCTFSYLSVHQPWQLFLAQAGLGITEACNAPTWSAMFSHEMDDLASGAHWGWADGLTHIAMGGAMILGGLIVQLGSFQLLFIIMGSLHCLGACYIAWGLRTRPLSLKPLKSI